MKLLIINHHQKTLFTFIAEIHRGLASLSDETRKGRPKSVVLPNNIDTVCKLIKGVRHVTYRKIEASLSILQTAIYI